MEDFSGYSEPGYLVNIENTSIISGPKLSKWKCELFGMGERGLTFRPVEGQEPNWFWRKMQYLILGNVWIKDK